MNLIAYRKIPTLVSQYLDKTRLLYRNQLTHWRHAKDWSVNLTHKANRLQITIGEPIEEVLQHRQTFEKT